MSTVNPTPAPAPAPTPAPAPAPNTSGGTQPVAGDRVVFPVIRNTQPTQQKPIPYSQDPYQEKYDTNLDKPKQTLFDSNPDPEIKRLIDAMGGPENFATHYRISPAELYRLYPEYADKRAAAPVAVQPQPQVVQQPMVIQPVAPMYPVARQPATQVTTTTKVITNSPQRVSMPGTLMNSSPSKLLQPSIVRMAPTTQGIPIQQPITTTTMTRTLAPGT
jgi:hypothetical protein